MLSTREGWPQAAALRGLTSGGGQVGGEQLFGQRPADLFVLVEGTGLAAVDDDLVSEGYLLRQEDPADRRAKRIYLTAKGHRTALVSQQAVSQAEEQIQALLGPRQYQQLRRNLARIAQLELPPATAISTAEDHPS
jgi:hypothetical protein